MEYVRKTKASILTREINNREVRLKPGDTIEEAICAANKSLRFKTTMYSNLHMRSSWTCTHTHALQAYPHVSFDHPIPTNQIQHTPDPTCETAFLEIVGG